MRVGKVGEAVGRKTVSAKSGGGERQSRENGRGTNHWRGGRRDANCHSVAGLAGWLERRGKENASSK